MAFEYQVSAMDYAEELGLKPLQRWLLVVLADHANQDGKCWPSQRRLCSRTGIGDRRTVTRHLDALQDQGVISIERRFKNGRYRDSNLYTINLPKADLKAPKSADSTVATRNPPPSEQVAALIRHVEGGNGLSKRFTRGGSHTPSGGSHTPEPITQQEPSKTEAPIDESADDGELELLGKIEDDWLTEPVRPDLGWLTELDEERSA